MERLFFGFGAILGFAGVLLGAFGSHVLRERLEPRLLEVFETGVRYQMYHALALLASAWACVQWPNSIAVWAGWFFLAGIAIFSGSLYVLTLSGLRGFGAITPLGGLALMAGWACLAWAALKS